jgi:tetratricopeptide (TPR) repeat protein
LLREVQTLSDQRKAAGLFPVSIEFWQDICLRIRGNSKLQNDYEPNAPGGLFHRVEERGAEIHAAVLSVQSKLELMMGLPSGRPESLNKYITAQLDAVNEVLKAARFKDAQEDLQRIGADLALLDAHQQARWHVQRGLCTWHLEGGPAAAPDFLRAAALYPDDDKIAAAKVRGLLFQGNADDAVVAGQAALERFPASAHVWIAHANAKLVKGLPVLLADAPVAMREDCDVLQLVAWARRKEGDLAGAVELSAKALEKASSAFFVRNAALAFALEAATSDPVKVAFGLVSDEALTALRRAVDAFKPRRERLWPVQSPESVQDTLVHLGYSYLVLGAPEEALALVDEARHEGVLSPRLKRVALDAYRDLDRVDDLVRCGRQWLSELEEEALMPVAESASGIGDVALVDAVQKRIEQLGPQQDGALDLLRAMRWVALWRSGTGKQQALDEVAATDMAGSESLFLICGGARILHAAKQEEAAEAALSRACQLVTQDTPSSKRLLLADLLFFADKFDLAAKHYELLAPRGRHSELHNRLLRCYIRTGAYRKARELLLSFPSTWTNDEKALSLAIDLGQHTSDWEFLVPLAELNCERRPLEAGAWLLRLALDLKMRRMLRFHTTLEAVPATLAGPTRLLAQVASLELRYGRQASGMRRLYGMFRRNLDDAEAASAYLIPILAGPADLPFMEDALSKVSTGSSVRLRSELGDVVTLNLDPEGFEGLPERDSFVVQASDAATALLGAEVGQTISLPGAFRTEQRFTVESVTTVFRRLLEVAQERVNSPLAAGLPLMSVPVPRTEDGADFSHMHAMLKRGSEHAKRVLEVYGENPITLEILSRLLGRNSVDVVAGWPNNAPPLYVCSGTFEQRMLAAELLQRSDAEYVVDVTTIAELACLECLDVLALLPRVYIATKSMERLESRLEEARLAQPGGQVFDDNGTMRYVEYGEQDRARQVAFIEGMVIAVRQHCQTVAAYGPETMPPEFERAHEVLEDVELAALLLAAEKHATLFTVDGRLADLARNTAGLQCVWPQEVLRHLLGQGQIAPHRYPLAVVRMLLTNRSFVSLGAFELVHMCLQGGYVLTEGLQRFKDCFAAASTDFPSTLAVAIEFLRMQARQATQLKAFAELLEHVIEAALRHPKGDREETIALARMLVRELATDSEGKALPYAPIRLHLEARTRVFIEILDEAIDSAVKQASEPSRRRAIKLRSLRCLRRPLLVFDGEAKDPEMLEMQPQPSTSGVDALCGDEPNLS